MLLTILMLFFCLQIDLKNADPERVEKQIEKVFDIPKEECIRVSLLKLSLFISQMFVIVLALCLTLNCVV